MSVHGDQCEQALGSPAYPAYKVHFHTENAARNAAIADGWRIGSDGQWWCSVCAPALICQTEGHQFNAWRHPVTADRHPAPSEYRYCRRCCVLESRPATRDEGESR
ncbi:MAG: hypothetical protein M3460_17530 [Actinomycetota bacterium]|nr:hypothetical protein [Actinomycetota bacterium]